MTAFENDVNGWLQGCGTQCAYEEFNCITECSSIQFPPVPVKPVPPRPPGPGL